MKTFRNYFKDIRLVDGVEYVSLEHAKYAIYSALEDNGLIMDMSDEKSLMEEFDRFRKIYLGTKRGLETEYKNMKKKHKDYATVIPTLYDSYTLFSIRRSAMKQRGDWLPMLPNLQTFINQRRWEELESISEYQTNNEKKYNESEMGVGVYLLNGKKYYGNGIEIPMDAPKRPSIQYTYNSQSNSWYIL